MWVRLKALKHIHVRGITTAFQKGDWVDVSEQTANLWIAQRDAESLDVDASRLREVGAGIVVTRMGGFCDPLDQLKSHVEMREGAPEVPWPRTLIWDTTCPLRIELLPTGFGLLATWDVAIPLWDYEKLACDIGDEEDRAATEKVVKDLRVPLYETRQMFVKKCMVGKRLIDTWRQECLEGADEKLAFLRALYQVKPLIRALPVTWVKPSYDPFKGR